MSGSYTEQDVLDELKRLSPGEVTLERVGGLVSGGEFLRSVRAHIKNLFSSDPDVIYHLFILAANRIKIASDSIVTDLQFINDNLLGALGSTPTKPTTAADSLLAAFGDVGSGSVIKRARAVRVLKSKVEEFVRTIGRDKFKKNPGAVLRAIAVRLARINSKSALITATHSSFTQALANYLNWSLVTDSVDAQLTPVIDRLTHLLSGENYSSADAALSASVALGLLDERVSIRLPYTEKYVGKVAVSAGTSAYLESVRSLPSRVSQSHGYDITVDGVVGTIWEYLDTSSIPSFSVSLNTTETVNTATAGPPPGWPALPALDSVAHPQPGYVTAVLSVSGYVNAIPPDIGNVVSGGTFSGTFRHYNNNTNTWLIEPFVAGDIPAGPLLVGSGGVGQGVVASATIPVANFDWARDLFPFPYGATTGVLFFGTLVGNTSTAPSYSFGGQIADPTALAQAVNTAFTAASVPMTAAYASSSNTMIFSYTPPVVAGSSKRIAVYDNLTALTPPNYDACKIFNLGGQAFGSDHPPASLTSIGFTGAVPTISNSPIAVQYFTDVVLTGPWDTITLPTGHSVVAGDSAEIIAEGLSKTYRVVSVTNTSAVLDDPVVFPFDGTALTVSATASGKFIRRRVKVTSPTTDFGKTSVTYESSSPATPTADSLGGFTVVDGVGATTKFSLKRATVQGSPVRLGDIILSNDGLDTFIGSVLGASGSKISADLSAGAYTTLPTDDLKIVSLGAHNYTKLYDSLSSITRSTAALPDLANFARKVGIFMSSGTDRYLVDEDVVALQLHYTTVSSVYGSYTANKVGELTKLFKLLGENKLGVVRDKLLSLDFSGLTTLTALELSPMDDISSGLLTVSSSMEGVEPPLIVTRNDDPRDFMYHEDENPLRYESVTTNESD